MTRYLFIVFLCFSCSCSDDVVVESPAPDMYSDSALILQDPIFARELENLKILSDEYEKDKTVEKQTHLICRQVNLMLVKRKGDEALNVIQAQLEVANKANCATCITELLRTQGQVLYAENHSKAEVIKKQANKDIDRVVKAERQKMLRNVLALGLISVLLLGLIVYRNSIQRKRANAELQEKNTLIAHQKMLVEEKQKEILDSIHYAKRIQRSLLPTEKYIDKSLNRLRKS